MVITSLLSVCLTLQYVGDTVVPLETHLSYSRGICFKLVQVDLVSVIRASYCTTSVLDLQVALSKVK